MKLAQDYPIELIDYLINSKGLKNRVRCGICTAGIPDKNQEKKVKITSASSLKNATEKFSRGKKVCGIFFDKHSTFDNV